MGISKPASITVSLVFCHKIEQTHSHTVQQAEALMKHLLIGQKKKKNNYGFLNSSK